jgi:hypothetical protein
MKGPISAPRSSASERALRLEPPDLLVVELVGDIDAAEAARLAAAARQLTSGREYVLVLCGISRLGLPTPEARRAVVEGFRPVPTRGVAFHGGSSRSRVVPNLVAQGLNLLSRQRELVPVRFFISEVEARAWLVQRREEIRRTPR